MNKRGVGVSGYLAKLFICLGIISLSLINFNSVHAETTLSVSTPENPILEISLSSNLIQLDLVPKPNNPDLKSGSITVSVGTNNIYGYSLYMDVDNTNLTRTQAINNTIPVIASLASNEEGYTDSTFTTNRWGYRTDNGNYFAIPSEEVLLNSNDEMTNQDPTTITFASKVDMSQQAGTYSTDVDLIAVVNPEPVDIMQDVSIWGSNLVDNEPHIVMDIRDEKRYEVMKINGNIWMIQNLRLAKGAKLTPSDSNVDAEWTLPQTEYEAGNWTEPRTKASNDEAIGYWYNFCAAFSGKYCYSVSGVVLQYDICPKDWHIPSLDQFNSISSYVSEFSPVAGGYYYGGSKAGALTDTNIGRWWSSTPWGSDYNATFEYNGTSLVPKADWRDTNKVDKGYFVRCIAK